MLTLNAIFVVICFSFAVIVLATFTYRIYLKVLCAGFRGLYG